MGGGRFAAQGDGEHPASVCLVFSMRVSRVGGESYDSIFPHPCVRFVDEATKRKTVVARQPAETGAENMRAARRVVEAVARDAAAKSMAVSTAGCLARERSTTPHSTAQLIPRREEVTSALGQKGEP